MLYMCILYTCERLIYREREHIEENARRAHILMQLDCSLLLYHPLRVYIWCICVFLQYIKWTQILAHRTIVTTYAHQEGGFIYTLFDSINFIIIIIVITFFGNLLSVHIDKDNNAIPNEPQQKIIIVIIQTNSIDAYFNCHCRTTRLWQ